MKARSNLQILQTTSGITAYYKGPNLDQGPLPALIYFALSGEESLTLDPYNQPVVYLESFPMRVFSFNLPYHGPLYKPSESIQLWAQDLAEDRDFITPFIDDLIPAIEELIEKGWIDGKRIGAAGLSRGGFTACHLAARVPMIETVLGFAPLTEFNPIPELQQSPLSKTAESLALRNLIPGLIGKRLRFYIGNRDMRVSTKSCFNFISELTEACFAARHRSPPVELIITPSIGHKGHGTGQKTFIAGAAWAAEQIL